MDEDVSKQTAPEAASAGQRSDLDGGTSDAQELTTQLTSQAVLEDLERQYYAVREERDRLQEDLQLTQARLRDTDSGKILKLEQELAECKQQVGFGHDKIRALEEQNKLSEERVNRSQVEGDRLRDEISRLSKLNAELSEKVSGLETQTKLKDSEAIPLFHEKERLRTELDSLQAHANWLEQELQSKSKDYLRVQQEARDRSVQYHMQIEQTTTEKNALEARLEVLQEIERELQEKVNQLSKDVLLSRQELVSVQQNCEEQVREERHLVDLQKEQLDRWHQRYNDILSQNEALKESATRAIEAGDRELEQLRSNLEQKYKQLLQEQESAYEKKLRTLTVVPATTQPDLQIALRIDHRDEGEEPLGLTDLYTKWEETKLALQREVIQRKHWQIQFTQLQKEISDSHPKMLRQVKEYDLAMDKLTEYEQRLAQTIADRDDAREETREARQEVSTLRKALATRKMESEELAKQVQALLISRAGGQVDDDIPTSVQEMQHQNQRLVVEQRRLSQLVEELESRFNADNLRNKLQAKEAELEALREQQKQQEVFVEQVVVQRDLYRTLLTTKDKDLLMSGDEETSALELVKQQSMRSKKLEEKNADLEGKFVAAQQECSRIAKEKEITMERLCRQESLSTELKNTVDRLERELLAARSDTARTQSDAEYHKDKCKRLESSLESSRSELQHVANAKHDLQKINMELQQSLSNATATAFRVEEEKRRVEGNLRLLRTQLETAKAAEVRLMHENAQLRSDIARQGSVSESVRRIEASLTAKTESEKDSLREEAERLTKKLEMEQANYMKRLEALNSKVEESDARIHELESERLKFQAEALKFEKLSIDSKTEVDLLSSRCAALEKELNATKKSIGDDVGEHPEVILQAKVNDLTCELDCANAELSSLRERVMSYQNMSKENESALMSMSTSIDELKKQHEQEKAEYIRQLNSLSERETSKQEIIRELTNDLAGHREEREKLEADLKAEILSLKTELDNKTRDLEVMNTSATALKLDVEALRNEAVLAQNNYERELAVHSEARSLLREAREKAEQEGRLRLEVEEQLSNLQRVLDQQSNSREQEISSLKEEINLLEKSLKDARDQNAVLHTQIETLAIASEKAQASRAASAMETERVDGSFDALDIQKVVSELREVVRFLRGENEILQTQLDIAKRNAERDRAAASVIRRSLDEARSELKMLQMEPEMKEASGESELSAKLRSYEDQMKILNDSNRLLREEADKLQSQVIHLKMELEKTQKSSKASEAVEQEFAVKIASLESERESLKRDLTSWKERVQNLVSKFNQIDPEDYRKLQEKVADMEKEKESLNAWKKTTEEESARIRTIAKNLNIKIREQSTLLEQQSIEIEKHKAEKSKLAKEASVDMATIKERDDLRETVEKLKKEAASAKTQLDGSNAQNDRLRETLRKFQSTIRELRANEKRLSEKIASMETANNQGLSTEIMPDVLEGKQQKTDSLSVEILPAVPSGGFKFGPNEKSQAIQMVDKSVQNIDMQTESSLRVDAAPFIPMKTAPPAPVELSSPSLKNVETERSKDILMAEVETMHDSKPIRRPSAENKELSMKEKIIEKKRKLEEAKLRKRKLEEAKKLQTTEEATSEKRPKVEFAAAATLVQTGETAEVASVSKSNADLKVIAEEQSKDDVANESEETQQLMKNFEVRKEVDTSSDASHAVGLVVPAIPKDSSSTSAQPSSSSASASLGGGSINQGVVGGSAFLDIKPPGNIGSVPQFTFGSSASITLPTPMQPSPSASPFDAFGTKSASFGYGFPSGTATSFSARPLFSSPATKAAEECETGNAVIKQSKEDETEMNT